LNENFEIVLLGIAVNFVLLVALRGIYKHGATFAKGFVGAEGPQWAFLIQVWIWTGFILLLLLGVVLNTLILNALGVIHLG
jgi:hypothetical protein